MTEMLDKVKKVGRGNFDVLPVSAEIVEIEELDQGINKMAHRISGLLENVRQEKEMQHLTELQLIQAQVNPHFLYNTLDTIVWLIEGGMTDDAVEMIPVFLFSSVHRFLKEMTSFLFQKRNDTL